jgi:hypothetical protein
MERSEVHEKGATPLRHEVCPVAGWYSLELQEMQLEAPVADWYVSARQLEHVLAPATEEYLPDRAG